MRLGVLIAIASLLFATHAQAGSVQVKKAKRKVAEKVAAALKKARMVCGNSALTAPVDWSGADKITDAQVKKSGRTRHNMYGVFAGVASQVVKDLAQLCKDKDYRDAIRKLRVVSLITPSDIRKKKKVSFKLSGSKAAGLLASLLHRQRPDEEAEEGLLSPRARRAIASRARRRRVP